MSRASILCFGELLLRLGAPGHELLLQQPRLDVHCGGAEANVGVSLAHFGHDVAMVRTTRWAPRYWASCAGTTWIPAMYGAWMAAWACIS